MSTKIKADSAYKRTVTITHPNPQRRYELALLSVDPGMERSWILLSENTMTDTTTTTYLFQDWASYHSRWAPPDVITEDQERGL